MSSALADAECSKKDHVVIFPFMAKGHTIPLLHLASALSRRGLHVTLVTTPANAPFLRRYLPSDHHPSVAIHVHPFPVLPPLPPGVESTDLLPSFDLYPTFLRATALLAHPFDCLLRRLLAGSADSPPLCLISDFFFGWTLPLCTKLGLPRLVFHGMSAFSMAVCFSFMHHRPHSGGAAAFHVPGTPPSLFLTWAEIPDGVRSFFDPDDPLIPSLVEACAADVNSWGVVVNSFAEIDRDYVELMESSHSPGARTWLVGPLCLLHASNSDAKADPGGCLRWLDEKAPNSVVYVSFGTQASVSDKQLDEVFHGLAESGHQFLLVARSPTWVPPLDPEPRGSMVVRGWVPQREVLRHAAVGGFLSHCGWNSVLESLSAGVPILAWPMMAEQALNARHVAELMGAGLSLGARPGETIGREEVAEQVRVVMGSGAVRERAEELKRAAEEAVAEGGSSQVALEEFLEKLREVRSSGGGSARDWLADGDSNCMEDALPSWLQGNPYGSVHRND